MKYALLIICSLLLLFPSLSYGVYYSPYHLEVNTAGASGVVAEILDDQGNTEWGPTTIPSGSVYSTTVMLPALGGTFEFDISGCGNTGSSYFIQKNFSYLIHETNFCSGTNSFTVIDTCSYIGIQSPSTTGSYWSVCQSNQGLGYKYTSHYFNVGGNGQHYSGSWNINGGHIYSSISNSITVGQTFLEYDTIWVRWDSLGLRDATYTLTEGFSGCSNAAVHDVNVLPNDSTFLPTSDFGISNINYTFSFFDSSINATNHFWDFGDGSTSTDLNPTHIYQNTGIFDVCLITENECGFDTLCQLADLTCGNSIPFGFLGNDTMLCIGDTLILSATHTGSTYLWQDGSTDSIFVVTQGGNYVVTITDSCGFIGTDHIIVEDGFVPAPDLGPDTTICYGQPYELNAFQLMSNYLWHDGNTFHLYAITQPDTYSVTVTNPCATGSDTVIIDFDSIPSPGLGPDTILCPGDSLWLSTYHPGGTYLWQDNSTDSSFLVTQPGTYSVTSTGACAISGIDNIQVLYDSIPNPELGPDIRICIGSQYYLNATHPGASYLWSTGSTSPSIFVTTTNTYWVEVSNQCGLGSDTVKFDVDTVTPVINIGSTYNLCFGDSLLLNAYYPGATYLWQNGDTSSSIWASQSGQYNVIAYNGCGPTTDNAYIFTHHPIVSLGNDTALCINSSITLDAGAGFNTYLWSNGSTAPQTNAFPPDTVSVVVMDVWGCTATDTIELTIGSVIQGNVTQGQNGNALQNTQILLIEFDSNNNSVSAVDTAFTDVNGYYQFFSDDHVIYIKATPDSATYPNEIPSYYTNSVTFQGAAAVPHPDCDTIQVDFSTVAGANPGGPGFIGGFLYQGAGKKAGIGDPISGVQILLVKDGEIHGHFTTKTNGRYSFSNLEFGTYEVWADHPKVNNDLAPEISVDKQSPIMDPVNLHLILNRIELTNATSIEEHIDESIAYVKVFPNPSEGFFTLQFYAQNLRDVNVTLYNTIGQIVHTEMLPKVQGEQNIRFNQQHLDKGIYYLSVKTKNEQQSYLKIVLQ